MLLKIAIGLLTFGLALQLATKSLAWPASAIALALGALAVTEISFGFAARPQIFTALGVAIELILLRRIHDLALRELSQARAHMVLLGRRSAEEKAVNTMTEALLNLDRRVQ